MSRLSLLSLAFCVCACVPNGLDDTADDTADSSCSETIVVDLDDVPAVSEGMVWVEDGVTLTLLANDQGGFNANHDEPTGCLWLFIGTKLRAETSCGASTVEIDTIDYCGSGGCAEATAFAQGTEVDTASSVGGNDPQTLVLDGDAIDALDVVGLETPVCEIRLAP